MEMKILGILTLLVALVDGASVKQEITLDNYKIAQLEHEHRRVRGKTVPTAANMQYLRWNPELAVEARNTAMDCYNVKPNRSSTKYGNVGLNEYISKGQMEDFKEFLRKVMDVWEAEVADYTFSNATCSGICGNYTQLVWAKTTHFGCGAATCQNLETGDGRNYAIATMLICRYAPAGNVKGLAAPFIEGDRCSKCDKNLEKCVENAFCSPADHPVVIMTLLLLPAIVGIVHHIQ